MSRDERGAASLLVVSCVAVLLLIGSALGVVAAMVRAHRAAQSTADLASLAGAAAQQRGEPVCAVTARVATANGGSLDACTLLGDDVLVTVTVPGPRWLGQTADLSAQARAGPG